MNSKEAYNTLFRGTCGYLVSQSIYVAAKLGIADHLAQGPMQIDDLAEKLSANTSCLYRVMRILSNQGIFQEKQNRTFALNDPAEFLRSDIHHSFKDFAILINASPCPFPAVDGLLECVKTGETPFDKRYGMPVFDYLAHNTELAQIVDAAMRGAHTFASDAFLSAYDLSGVRTFADIGGGSGEALSKVLKKYETIDGILFDLPHVVERTRKLFGGNGLKDRCKMVPGNFHQDVPISADVYFLRQVLHDWTDDQCVNILKNIAANAKPDSRLLISDCVIKEKAKDDNAIFYDGLMLYITGGRERTEEEFSQLFEKSGFRMTKIIPTDFWFGVIEGRLL